LNTDATISEVLDTIAELIERQDFATALKEMQRLEQGDTSGCLTVESGRLHLYAADALYHCGNYRDAIVRATQAIECLRLSEAHSLYAVAKLRRGYAFMAIGEYHQGADDFREARFTYKRVEDLEGELTSCNCLAKCAFSNGQYSKANDYLELALSLAMKIGANQKLGTIHANLGRVLTLLGQLRPAKDYLTFSLTEYDSMSRIKCCNDHAALAYLLILMRDHGEAVRHIDISRTIANENSLARQEAILHEYAGELAFWQGDYDKAEEHYREAIKIGMEIAPKGDLISQSYRLLAELQVARNQLDDAEESCNRAWVVAEKITERLELGAIQRTRGEIAVRRGNAEAAKTAFEEAIRILSEIGAKYELARAHLQAGEAAVFGKDYRRFNLGAAGVLFERIGVEYWQTRTTEALNRLMRPADVPAAGTLSRPRKIECNGPFIAASEPMQKILARVEQIKDTDATVLLLGETGVGKDRLAEYIHQLSNRAQKPFQIISAANYPTDLLPGELFGHTRGAFTGADTNKPGLLEAANGGTVYLDEISEVSAKSQVLLLKFLERKEILRLGGHRQRRLDVRFIAASNRNLPQAVNTGRFRRDLYHRLSQEEIILPPLHERPEDIPELAVHFLTTLGFPKAKAAWLLNSPFGEWLKAERWSGNVRQLQNILGRFMKRVDGAGESEMLTLAREVLTEAGLLPDPEREKLLAILKTNDWNQRQTARELGLSHTTIGRKIKQFNIIPPAGQ
jgi:DNA-binding NtrC family response regulator/uncharacterized protein HemY